MARPRKYPQGAANGVDVMQARLLKGTLAEMDKVLMGGEIRATFLRFAIEQEIALRRKEKVFMPKAEYYALRTGMPVADEEGE